jgi:hypothetical protein
VRQPGSLTYTILHVNGFHEVNVAVCCCPGAPLASIQLCCSQLWPAAGNSARTAASFELLRLFQTVDHRAHVNVTDMYRALELLTDGAGLRGLTVRVLLRHACMCADSFYRTVWIFSGLWCADGASRRCIGALVVSSCPEVRAPRHVASLPWPVGPARTQSVTYRITGPPTSRYCAWHSFF